MSELNKSQFPSSSNSQQHIVIEANAPINAVFAANTFTCNAPLLVTVNQSIKKNDPQPPLKLMFQVKNPVHTFTGRGEFLKELHYRIQQCRKEGAMISIISHTSSITGLGGIGKSETVRMYVHKFGHEYDNVVWIDAEKPSEAEFQLTSLAFYKLGIFVKDHNGNPRHFSQILEDIYEKLCKKPKLLLIIFDNAEALDDTDTHALGIRQLLPPQIATIESPVVLITSRQQYWEDLNVVKLGLWKIEECIEFIYKRLHLTDTPENMKDATELAELFDRLPIALEMASSVIAEQLRKRKAVGKRVYGIHNMIAEYKAGDRKMLSKRTQQNSTQVTMQLLLTVSLDKIKACEEGQLAIRILSFMAYLSPTSIPKEMMHKVLSDHDEDKLDSAFTLLADYSLIQCYDTHFTIHRVFQDIVITTLPDLRLFTDKTIYSVEYADEMKVLNELFGGLKEYASTITPIHEDYNAVVTNIVHSTDYIIQKSMVPDFYSYIQTFGDLITLTHCETAIKFYKALIESDRSSAQVQKGKIHQNLSTISYIFLKNGKYAEAQETLNELLKELQCAYSDDFHKEILLTQMRIALCVDAQGKTDEALQLFYIVKAEQEKVLEPLDPDILQTTSNISYALFSQGRSEEAMEFLNPLENDAEKALGPLHELTLEIKGNKALTLNQQGKHVQALELFNKLVKNHEQVFGPLHRHTLMTKMNMAGVLAQQGSIEEALRINYSLEKDMEKVLGPLHPDSLLTKMNIANCMFEQGKLEEALEINYILENDMETVLGPLHPLTLKTKMNIANCLSSLKKNEDALKLFSIVEKDQEKVLGPLHPDSLFLKMYKASTLSDMGRTNEALNLFYIIEKDMEKVLGSLHPYVLKTKMSIANCLGHQGKYEDALKIFCIVEKDEEKVLGPFLPQYLEWKEKMLSYQELINKIDKAL